MVVDELRQHDRDGRVERRARVRWRDGEFTISIRLPAGAAAQPGDATPYLAATLLPAMHRGEDLHLEGAVSPRLLDRVDLIQSVYLAWKHTLRRVAVTVAERAAPAPGTGAVACCFSRGVDSSYSAIAPRPGRPALTSLLFADGLDPRHDAATRAAELRLAGEAADTVGLPLLAVSTDLRLMTDVLMDWMDMAGAGLAFIALSAAGALGRVVVPSSDTYRSLQPCGTSPLLDPLFSSEGVEIEHDTLDLGRAEKVAALVERRPDLLPHLKVCFAENRPDNCGWCGKCLLTMSSLLAAGALEQATAFPPSTDPDRIRDLRLNALHLVPRLEWADVCRRLDAGGEQGRVREAVLALLADGGPVVDPGDAAHASIARTFRSEYVRTVVAALRDGRPYPPLPDAPSRDGGEAARVRGAAGATWSGSIGLVRAVDAASGRHVYGLGGRPAGGVCGELGSLCARGGEDAVAVRVNTDGLIATDERVPAVPRRSPARTVRWLLAPLRWPGFASPGARLRLVTWRARRLALARPRPLPVGEPVGYLYRAARGRAPWPDRVALYSAIHPVTGDQLLCRRPEEATDMGYGDAVLLGYLDALAPVTGRLALDTVPVPWASRLGLHARR